jgi:protease I
MKTKTYFLILSLFASLFMHAQDQDNRVLFIATDGYNTGEFWQPYFGLLAAGYEIDVASDRTGLIDGAGKHEELDYRHGIHYPEINPDDYIALVIPGGYSPAKLEKYDGVIDLIKEFNNQEKPIAAICHGPRLLAKAGVLENKRATCWYEIKDEVPETWSSRQLGTYYDDPVVKDGNLITSRYPGDGTAFTKAIINDLCDGSRPDFSNIHVLAIDAGANRKMQYAFTITGLPAQGIKVTRVRQHQLKEITYTDYSHVLILGGPDMENLTDNKPFQKLIASVSQDNTAFIPAEDNKANGFTSDVNLFSDNLEKAVVNTMKWLRPAAEMKRVTEEPSYNAVIALAPGFNEEVYFFMKNYLMVKGYQVAVAGHAKGSIKSLNGLIVPVDFSFSEDKALQAQPLIVAPGGLSPGMEKDDSIRQQWILDKWKNGAYLVSFGFDSWRLANREEFDNQPVSATEQVRWKFKKGGKFSEEKVNETETRFITAKGSSAIPEVVNLMDNIFLTNLMKHD